MNQEIKEDIINGLKVAVFIIALVIVVRVAMLFFGNGKITALEGYLYSFAAQNETDATSSDATSCDATSSDATSCDATSSDATSCDATSSDATNGNSLRRNEALQQQRHLQEIQQVVKEEKSDVIEEEVTYNTSEINDDVIAKIQNDNNIKRIIINADNNQKIQSRVFEAIKNTDKKIIINYNGNEFIFNGQNIKNPKEIDVSMVIKNIKTDTQMEKYNLPEGIVIEFPSNGELPGIAKVRIKATETVKNLLKYGTVFAYYYDDANNDYILLSDNIKLTEDGFYEFAIEHNSKYILVNEKLDEKLLAGYIDPEQNNEEKEVVSFLESHKAYIAIIGMCALAIVLVSIIVFVDKKGIKRRKMKEQENEIKPKAFENNDEKNENNND